MLDSIPREYNETQTFEAPTFFKKAAKFLGGVVGNVTGNVAGNVVGNVAGNVVGNVTGNTSGSAGSCTGNAATATLAATATTALNVPVASNDLATVAPTNAQMAAAFPTGSVGILHDTDAGNGGAGAVTYFCVKVGTTWAYEIMTAGV